MQNDRSHLNDQRPSSSQKQEIDYTPKSYTSGDHVLISLKFFAVAVCLFLIFWIYESM